MYKLSLEAILHGQVQNCQSKSWPSDIPGENGAVSEAIKMKLQEVGLADLGPLLRHRGIATMYALDH